MKYYYAVPPVLIGISIVLVQSQVAVALSAPEVEKIGREITVQIVDSQNPTVAGSGVIIKHTGNTYTVLTAYHVVKAGKKQIFTPDKQSYQINNVKPLQKIDLAVVEFSSNKNYSLAKIGDSDKATNTTTVYVTGFPAKTAVISNPEFFFNKGQVNANGAAQRDGYNIIYDNDTLKGMSGGAVLNEQGELIAIHGRADEQEVGEKTQSKVITGLGITIYSALRQMLAVGVDVGVRPEGVVAAAPKADDFYIKAYEKYNQKDYKGAIADFTQAIRLNPNYADAYYDRGNARVQLGDNTGAIADFNKAIDINPNDAKTYATRSLLRYQLADNTGAIADSNKAIRINPNFAQPYVARGLARSALGDKQGAIADYNIAIKIDPNFAIAYSRRGVARRELGDKQGAIADYNIAIKIDPNFASAYSRRGVARRELGDKQGAIADYNIAIKIDPNYASAYYNRGIARYDLGDKQAAIADYNTAIKIDPNYASAYRNRGLARAELGDKQGAITDFNTAIKINPNDAFAYAGRGVAREELGDKQGAIADLQKGAELFRQQGNTALYQQALEEIRKVQQ